MLRRALTAPAAIATLISFVLGGPLALTSVAAAETIVVKGKVLAHDGATAVEHAVVTMTRKATGEAFRSAPANAEGEYRVSDVPDGEYAISVQTPEGVFDLPSDVVIKSGMPSTMTVILPAAAAVPAQGSRQASNVARSKAWLAIPIAGAIVLTTILLKNDNNADQDASPSTP